MKPARERLFVYGTLRPGCAPASLASVVATLRSLGPARVRGRLYDLGEFPGAILDAAATGFVHGEIVEFGDATPPLTWFDAYEEFDPAEPEAGPFRRERVAVETAAGDALACWIYVLVREPQPARPIPSGAFERRAI